MIFIKGRDLKEQFTAFSQNSIQVIPCYFSLSLNPTDTVKLQATAQNSIFSEK